MKPEQIQELRELKKQETKLRIAVNRSIRKNMNADRRAAMEEERENLLKQMIPLRDSMLSQIEGADDWLMVEAVRFYYGGLASYEIADIFGYRNGEGLITGKIRKAERQVAEP